MSWPYCVQPCVCWLLVSFHRSIGLCTHHCIGQHTLDCFSGYVGYGFWGVWQFLLVKDPPKQHHLRDQHWKDNIRVSANANPILVNFLLISLLDITKPLICNLYLALSYNGLTMIKTYNLGSYSILLGWPFAVNYQSISDNCSCTFVSERYEYRCTLKCILFILLLLA